MTEKDAERIDAKRIALKMTEKDFELVYLDTSDLRVLRNMITAEIQRRKKTGRRFK